MGELDMTKEEEFIKRLYDLQKSLRWLKKSNLLEANDDEIKKFLYDNGLSLSILNKYRATRNYFLNLGESDFVFGIIAGNDMFDFVFDLVEKGYYIDIDREEFLMYS